MQPRISRPRHRKPERRNRRHSRRFQALLNAMSTKFYGEETRADVTAVTHADDELAVVNAPLLVPVNIVGAPPRELRSGIMFLSGDGTAVQVHRTAGHAAGALHPLALAAWDLAPAATSASLGNDTIFIPALFGLHTGSGPVRLTTTGTLPTGLSLLTDYWVIQVDSDRQKFATSKANADAGIAVNLTAQGSGVHTMTWTHTFASTDVDATANTITIADHGLHSADGPFRLTTSAADLPAPLLTGTDYWVVVLDEDTLQLATTWENAFDDVPTVINLTDGGTGTHTLIHTKSSAVVSPDTDQMHFPGHEMQSGDGPVQLTTTGGLPTGLSTGTDYWVIAASDDTLWFATSYANALEETAVNVTGAGTGVHSIDRTFSLGVDLSAAGIEEWLRLGVKRELMRDTVAADADDIFKAPV